MAKTKSGAKDARFRHREPILWQGVRAETLRHVPHGDGFVRPDLCFWIDGTTVRAAVAVSPEASDAMMATILDEALAAWPQRAPSELVVATSDIAEALRARFGDRFAVRVRPSRTLHPIVSETIHARGSDLADPPRTNLDRGSATENSVSRVHADMVELTSDPRLATPSAEMLSFTLRAPQLGWIAGNVGLHTADRSVTLFKTRADSRGRTPFRGSARPPETRALTLRFEAVSPENARAQEAERYGWTDPRDDSHVLVVRAHDVAFIPRPLAAGDVAVAAAAVTALRAWLATHGGTFAQIAAGATVSAGPEVELSFDGIEIDPAAPVELARARWFDTMLPAAAPTTVSPAEVARVRARLVNAAPGERRAVARALGAEGGETVAALLAWLDDDGLWNPAQNETWMVPWVLATLAQSGDPRVPAALPRALADHLKPLGDFIFDGLAQTLAAMGPTAIDALTAVLRGEPLYRYLRVAAGEALYRIGVVHPGERERIAETFAALYEGLRGGVDDDGMLASALYAESARMRSPRVDDAVRAAHALGIWDGDFVEFEAWVAEQREAAWSLGGLICGESLDALLANPWWEK